MEHHHAEKCPQCGRSLTPDEIYCYFCELDLSKLRKFQEKPRESTQKAATAKKYK